MMSEHKCLSMLMEWGRDSRSALMVTRSNLFTANAEVRGIFTLETEEPKILDCKQWLKHFSTVRPHRPKARSQATTKTFYIEGKLNPDGAFGSLPSGPSVRGHCSTARGQAGGRFLGSKRVQGQCSFPPNANPKKYLELLAEYPQCRPPPLRHRPHCCRKLSHIKLRAI